MCFKTGNYHPSSPPSIDEFLTQGNKNYLFHTYSNYMNTFLISEIRVISGSFFRAFETSRH